MLDKGSNANHRIGLTHGGSLNGQILLHTIIIKKKTNNNNTKRRN